MKTLAFQISKGGKFNNGGYLYYKGVMTLDQLISHVDNSGKNLFFNEENGSYYDCNGNEIIDAAAVATGLGELDFDGIYDTWYVTTLEDLSEKEVEAILRTIGYVETDIVDYVKENFSELVEVENEN
jgi:hypothetical protein